MIVSTALCQTNSPSVEPSFDRLIVQDRLKDGYWIESFQISKTMPVGFLSSGLVSGEIRFHQNPYMNSSNNGSILLTKVITPIGMDKADISGDGYEDFIVCFDYGNTILDINMNGGHIIWLENPGHLNGSQPWKQHYIGRSPAMHRLKIGHFTQNERWEIVALPVVGKPVFSAVPVTLFRQPENVSAAAWECETISSGYFHVIHDVVKFLVNSSEHLLIASQEGIHWLYYNTISKTWLIEQIVEGEQAYVGQTRYYGCGGVAVGKFENDSFAYIATFEPFHGNVVAVYTKTTNNALNKMKWQRTVLDIYGYPDRNGEGPAHHITAGDFDNDGNDEFLVALRGPAPNQGVFYYKPMDLTRVSFSKWRVSSESAARIAVADFNDDGYLDFATIGYYVPGYYTPESIGIYTFLNKKTNTNSTLQPGIQVTRKDNDLLLKVPRIHQISKYESIPFLRMAGITLSLETIPSYSSRFLQNNTFVKVLSGVVTWIEPTNQSNRSLNRSRSFLCAPRRACSLSVNSYDQRIKTGNSSALVLIWQLPANQYDIPRVENIRTVAIENPLPSYVDESARQMNFQFIKVEELDWGKESFKGIEFYNMRGVNISFNDNDENLAYIQFWAAGTGVSAGVHNHRNDRFAEVHVSMINGNGDSGMHYLNSSRLSYNPETTPDNSFVQLPLPSFYEHGPLWDLNTRGEPVLRSDGTVVYPWHKWQSSNMTKMRTSSTDTLCSKYLETDDKPEQKLEGNKIFSALKSRILCSSVSNQSYDIWVAIEFNNRLARWTP